MKKLVESTLGIKMTEKQARSIDSLLKTLPKECKTLKRKASTEGNELIQGQRADISLVSTENIDRENEVVLAKGINLDNFRVNPVVTFNHDYDGLPVGKALWIKQVPNGIKAKTLYATKPTDWQGQWLPDAIFSLVQQNILLGKSIGFIPTKIRPPSNEEKSFKGANAVIESCVLLEYAVATIPCNQDSLVQAVSKGIADEASVRKLGLLDTKKKIKKTTDYIEAMKYIKIDPERIAELVLENLRNRGKV